MKAMKRRVQISATIPADLLQAVDHKLRTDELTRSGLITDLFTDWLCHESN